ncbi:MAG: hypothetical protein AB7N91_00800 [Candidatus Tectimicrobiota bacterium]
MKRFIIPGMLMFLALTVLSWSIGWTAEPWLSAPSGLRQGETTEIRGGNLPAGAQVLLTIAKPAGSSIEEHVVNVDTHGNISFVLKLSRSGPYLAEVRSLDAPEALPLAYVDLMVARQLAPSN